jgi:hypothetical protein
LPADRTRALLGLIAILRILRVWLGPASAGYDAVRIFALSSALGHFYLYFGAFAVESGASHYTDWADAIVSGADLKGNPAMYIRDVGMALVMLIGGFPFTRSLVGITIIQVAMGMVMPLLVYLALRPWFPRAAYYVAIASAISLAPFLLAKTIHHDQPYVFFLILSVCLLNAYIHNGRATLVYALTLTVFAMSLVRQTGKGLYPLVALAMLMEGPRRGVKHVAVAVALFVALNIGYAQYRHSMLGDMRALGITAFENVYLNSSEFGVKLSPEFGPNVKHVIERIHQCSLPSPAQAKNLTGDMAPSNPDFMAEHFYKYTADELVEKVFTQTHREYLYFLQGCIQEDLVLLMAALETAKARPLFVLGYTLRNSFQLLFDPGWLHGRHTTEPHFRGGLGFPLGGVSSAGRSTIGDRLPQPALAEASFIPLPRQPQFVQAIYFRIEKIWGRVYHPITIGMGCLMVVTWISIAIGLLQRTFRTERLERWSELWLSRSVEPAALGITLLLLGNVAVTGLFIDSYYRYDFSLLMLKIMSAGIGGAVVIHIVQTVLLPTWRRDARLTGS